MPLAPDAPSPLASAADRYADAACDLADHASPSGWSAEAVDDVLEGIDAAVAALAAADPRAARILKEVPLALEAMRRYAAGTPADAASAPVRTPRTRRGLGRGWQGMYLPRDDGDEPQ